MEEPLVSQTLANGPASRRWCTDLSCCVIFLVFFAAMILMGVLAYPQGDPEMLWYPYDSSGNQCGRPDTATADYSYLYFVKIKKDDVYSVCVKKCPSSDTDDVKCYANAWVDSCDFTLKDDPSQVYSPYDSTSSFERFCLPTSDSQTEQDILDVLYGSDALSAGKDLIACWTMILGVMGISLLLSVLYLVFLRYCAACALWSSIFLLVLVLVASGLFVYWTADVNYDKYADDMERVLYIALAVVLFLLALVLVIFVMIKRKRINLVAAVMESAACFIAEVPSVFGIPILLLLMSVAFYVYWLLALVYLYTSGDVVHKDRYWPLPEVDLTAAQQAAFWFELVGVLWVNSFNIALAHFMVAYVCCSWYFHRRDNQEKHPVIKAFCLGCINHLGSIALGSFVLAATFLFKPILQFIAHSLYKEGTGRNAVTRCCCGCLSCFARCFESCVKYLDSQAYVTMAMTGKSFCQSARLAYDLVLRNAVKFAVLGGSGGLFNLLGRLLVTALSTYIGYVIITQVDYYNDQISSPVPAAIAFILASYVVASVFMSVFEMASEAIMQAYIIDALHHGDKAQFAPTPLQEYLDNN